MRGTGPDLVPDQDHVRGGQLESLERAADLDGGQGRVRAAGDGDGVLPVAVDEDERDAGRLVRELDDAGDVDPLGLQGRSGLGPERVGADRADERHRRPEPGRRDRRVAALAAVVALEPPADDRLAGGRQPVDDGDEVDVDGADDDHPAHAVRTP